MTAKCAGDYYVNPNHPAAISPDDTDGFYPHSGTDPNRPWSSLSQVWHLLETDHGDEDERYRGGVRIWIHHEAEIDEILDREGGGETDGIRNHRSRLTTTAHGTFGSCLHIGSYRQTPSGFIHAHPGASIGRLGGRYARDGLVLLGAEFVVVDGIHFVSAQQGISVRGCQDVEIRNCHFYENRRAGLTITVDSSTSKPRTPSRCIVVEDCVLYDNGKDTSGGNMALGMGTANCAVRRCTFSSTKAIRGVDGLTLDHASSGHVIEDNQFLSNASLPTHWEDGDGIDLKGVYQRNPKDGALTIVRRNRVHRNASAGIVVHNGCRGLHIYENDIGYNRTGILIMPGRCRDEDVVRMSITQDRMEVVNHFEECDDDADCFGIALQERIYIYRNIIHGNGRHGINIKMSTGATLPHPDDSDVEALDDAEAARRFTKTVFRDIQVVNNTIDRNGASGVAVSRNAFNLDGDIKAFESAAAIEGFGLQSISTIISGIVICMNAITRNGAVELIKGEALNRFSLSQLLLQTLLVSDHGEGLFAHPEVFADLNFFEASQDQGYVMTNLLLEAPGKSDPEDLDAAVLDIHVRQKIAAVRRYVVRVDAPTELDANAHKLRTLAQFESLGYHGRVGAVASSPSHPGPVGYADASRADYRLGLAPAAVSSELWGRIELEMPETITIVDHVEEGIPVPIARDIDGASVDVDDTIAFGAYHKS